MSKNVHRKGKQGTRRPETASQRTEIIPRISDKIFLEIFERVETSVGKRIRETEMGQGEILKKLENLSSKIIVYVRLQCLHHCLEEHLKT